MARLARLCVDLFRETSCLVSVPVEVLTSGDVERLRAETFVRRVEYHQVIASTNDYALQLTQQEHLDAPLLIVAAEQTAGRGRGRNVWWSGPGGLMFSLVLEPDPRELPRAKWPRVSLTAGLSVCEAVERVLPGVPCGLKWPNDVWIGSRKICGILVEVPPQRPPLPPRLVIGIGLNVNNSLAAAPADIQSRAASLIDLAGGPLSMREVLTQLLQQFAANLVSLATDEPSLPDRWRARCVLHGRVVEILQGEQTVRGVCHGIDIDGALLLETPERRERLFGGIVTAIE
jgi:BirA family biotin operon repressor/biotin-[acetyl-CoA-carboxylase] ligase